MTVYELIKKLTECDANDEVVVKVSADSFYADRNDTDDEIEVRLDFSEGIYDTHSKRTYTNKGFSDSFVIEVKP